jgi:hypothetical protein
MKKKLLFPIYLMTLVFMCGMVIALSGSVHTIYPNGEENVSGVVEVRAGVNLPDGDTIYFYYKNGVNGSDIYIDSQAVDMPRDYVAYWNTTQVQNGEDYLVRTELRLNGSITDFDYSDEYFTVSN